MFNAHVDVFRNNITSFFLVPAICVLTLPNTNCNISSCVKAIAHKKS